MPKYAELIYNGFWFAPEREMLQAAIDKSQQFVTGTVKLKLYKGGAAVVGRPSPYSLYDQDLVTFEEGKVAYDHRDAAGFIDSMRCACARLPSDARGSISISNQAQCVIARFRRAIQYSPLKWVRSATGSAHRDASAPGRTTWMPPHCAGHVGCRYIRIVTLRFSPKLGFSPVSRALASSMCCGGGGRRTIPQLRSQRLHPQDTDIWIIGPVPPGIIRAAPDCRRLGAIDAHLGARGERQIGLCLGVDEGKADVALNVDFVFLVAGEISHEPHDARLAVGRDFTVVHAGLLQIAGSSMHIPTLPRRSPDAFEIALLSQ